LDTLIYLFCIISVYIITFVAIASSFDCILTKIAKSVDCVGERISVVLSVFFNFSIHLFKRTLVLLALTIFTMYDDNNTGGPSNQAKLDSSSPDRPPQYNFRNCGYDCGLGCKKAVEDEGGGGSSEKGIERGSDGDSDGDSDAVTAVGEDENGYLIAEWQGEDGDAGATDDSEENMSNSDIAEDDTAGRLSSQGDYDAMSESLVVEPCATRDHSPVASVGGSVRSLSPNPGIIYWPASPLPVEYHFLHTPLRLSPQYEHCRGDPASHLVGPDRSTSFYLIEQV